MKSKDQNPNTNVIRFLFVMVVIWSFAPVFAVSAATGFVNEHNLNIQIAPQLNGNTLLLDKLSSTNSAGQKFSVTRLDFLISDFALRHSDGSWLEKTNAQAFFKLGENRSSFTLEKIPAGVYDKIRFHVGLRPEINHSKPEQYPANHPLNPNLNGLNWGWAGG